LTSPSDSEPAAPLLAGNALVGVPDPGVEARYFDGVRSEARLVSVAMRDERVVVSGGGVQRDEPLGAVSISERIGATPRFVRFSDGGFCEVTDQAGFDRLLHSAGLDRHWLSRWEDSRRMAAAAVLLLAFIAVFGYWVALPWMAESAARRLPRSALDQVSAQVLSGLDRLLLEPSQLSGEERFAIYQEYLRLRLPRDVAIKLEFRSSPSIGANAFALPSGTVVVTDELVRLSKAPEEVIAVLAHEAGHVDRRHGLRNMIQSSVVSLFITWYIGDVSALAAAAPTALLEARYSRDLEREADAYAVQVLTASGIRAGTLADILERLRDEDGGSDDGAFAYLASHPPTAERIAFLRGADQRGPGQP
jgi:Zn-dependent protease with chaperone function